jgi:hypothetical protein
MYCRELNKEFISDYTKNGQALEQIARYTLTGERLKADNIPHNVAPDCGIYQIKSAKATVCVGLDLEGYIAEDVAIEFMFCTRDRRGYCMTKAEWLLFCQVFGYASTTSDGRPSWRLRDESKKMLRWLERYTH